MSNRAGRTGRRRYSEQERAERAREDARLMDDAQAHLADPDLVARRAAQALGMSQRILGYSIANQMLLFDQAEQRGIPLRDVDTFRGWNQRGRQVRKGERGLRIVRPVGKEEEESGSDSEPDRDHGDKQQPRIRFRFLSVFDISQTFVVATAEEGETACACGAEAGEPCRPGCACPGCTGQLDPVDESGQEPGDVAWNKLQEQITSAGYRFDYPARPADLDGQKLRVDHTTGTVHVSMAADAGDQGALTGLAVILADLLTRAAAERSTRRAAAALEAAPTN
jgi:hypothetical protein